MKTRALVTGAAREEPSKKITWMPTRPSRDGRHEIQQGRKVSEAENETP
jgi:hypothetical protein